MSKDRVIKWSVVGKNHWKKVAILGEQEATWHETRVDTGAVPDHV